MTILSALAIFLVIPLALPLATAEVPKSPFDRVVHPPDSKQLQRTHSDRLAVNGSGTMATERHILSSFNEVSFRGFGHLHIKQGATESLTIEAEDTIIPQITVQVRGRRLILGFSNKRSQRIHNTKPIDLYLTVKQLRGLTVHGSGQVTFETPLHFEEFFLQVNGSATLSAELNGGSLLAAISGSPHVKAKGRILREDVTLNGPASFLAGDLVANQAEVVINGDGKAIIHVKETLNAIINGNGSIRYLGQPRISQKIRGDGTLEAFKN